MAANKTAIEPVSAQDFIANSVEPSRRAEAEVLAQMFQEEVGDLQVWTGGMLGAGTYTYAYPSGRKGEWFPTGFAMRKAQITLYFLAGFEHQSDLLEKVGKYKLGQSCFYVKKLTDIDLDVVRQMIRRNQENMAKVSVAE